APPHLRRSSHHATSEPMGKVGALRGSADVHGSGACGGPTVRAGCPDARDAQMRVPRARLRIHRCHLSLSEATDRARNSPKVTPAASARPPETARTSRSRPSSRCPESTMLYIAREMDRPGRNGVTPHTAITMEGMRVREARAPPMSPTRRAAMKAEVALPNGTLAGPSPKLER